MAQQHPVAAAAAAARSPLALPPAPAKPPPHVPSLTSNVAPSASSASTPQPVPVLPARPSAIPAMRTKSPAPRTTSPAPPRTPSPEPDGDDTTLPAYADPHAAEITSASIADSIRLHVLFFLSGLRAAVDAVPFIFAVYHSRRIRSRVAYCLLLNGVIFLGSQLLYNQAVLPILLAILSPLRSAAPTAVAPPSPPTPHSSAADASGIAHFFASLFVDIGAPELARAEQDRLWLEHLQRERESTILYHVSSTVLSFMYYAFWIYPVYIFSFIANNIYFQDIASRSYEIQVKYRAQLAQQAAIGPVGSSVTSHAPRLNVTGTRPALKTASSSPALFAKIIEKSNSRYGNLTLDDEDIEETTRAQRSAGQTYNRILSQISDDIYRAFVFFNFYVQAMIAYKTVPYLGPVISFMMFSWHASFYSFEFKWRFKNWSLQQQLQVLEEHWAYFLGFGFPCTALNFFWTPFISAGVFSILFPVYIVLASEAKPLPIHPTKTSTWPLPVRFPIFKLSRQVNNAILGLVTSIVDSQRRRKALAAKNSANSSSGSNNVSTDNALKSAGTNIPSSSHSAGRAPSPLRSRAKSARDVGPRSPSKISRGISGLFGGKGVRASEETTTPTR